MRRVGWKPYAAYMLFLCIALAMAVLSACDDSSSADADEPTARLQSSNSSSKKSSSSKKAYPESFKPNDKEYPYANIPRIVIYTENQQKIKDRETEIPAKLQIWGKKEAESEIFDLTIRGRGNTSWSMPKKSYKIEFVKKQSMLGMPKDKDWALIANYADKTLMKNYIAYRLSAALGAYYAPRCEFAELYLNGEYLGVYLLTETIKMGKNRIDMPKTNDSYIMEFELNPRKNQQIFYTYTYKTDSIGKPFRVHYPKDASSEVLLTIQEYVENFERYLKTVESQKENHIVEWLDVDEYIKHYWVQEFSKNPDAAGNSSVFFSWEKNGTIKMGPVWDFDLAFGGHSNEKIDVPEEWYIKTGYYWYSRIFRDDYVNSVQRSFWNENRTIFVNELSVVDSVCTVLNNAALNNFKKWDILQSTEYVFHRHAYKTYAAAVDDLKLWISKRIQWIEKNI